MPSVTGEEADSFLSVETEELKTVSDYSGLDFQQCLDLDMRAYKLLFRDAFIYNMKQTEKGREYLEDCWILQQTQPDKDKLRNKFGGEAKVD